MFLILFLDQQLTILTLTRVHILMNKFNGLIQYGELHPSGPLSELNQAETQDWTYKGRTALRYTQTLTAPTPERTNTLSIPSKIFQETSSILSQSLRAIWEGPSTPRPVNDISDDVRLWAPSAPHVPTPRIRAIKTQMLRCARRHKTAPQKKCYCYWRDKRLKRLPWLLWQHRYNCSCTERFYDDALYYWPMRRCINGQTLTGFAFYFYTFFSLALWWPRSLLCEGTFRF